MVCNNLDVNISDITISCIAFAFRTLKRITEIYYLINIHGNLVINKSHAGFPLFPSAIYTNIELKVI